MRSAPAVPDPRGKVRDAQPDRARLRRPIAQLVDGSLGMAYGVTSTTMLLAVGIAPASASAAVHLSEIGTTLMSGFAHHKLGNVDWRTVSIIAVPGGLIAAPIAAWFVKYLAARVLGVAAGGFIVLTNTNTIVEAVGGSGSTVAVVAGGAVRDLDWADRDRSPAGARSAAARAAGAGGGVGARVGVTRGQEGATRGPGRCNSRPGTCNSRRQKVQLAAARPKPYRSERLLGMRVSAKSDYALRALIELARRPEGDAVNAEEIGRLQDVPHGFLLAILADLRRAGIVVSQRGQSGGWRMARDPGTVTVADVIRAVDGPLVSIYGLRPEAVTYNESTAVLQLVWIAARSGLREVFEQVSIANLAAQRLPDPVMVRTTDEDAWQPR
ncbi:MAG: Rrf2 family transcriptional regulator [Actinophytocola sp.]|nr:Rrf2 family transcriptional regulator [Actinophytocola sp.]